MHTCSWFFSLSAVRTEISCFSLNTRSSLGGEHTYVYRREGLIEVFESSPTHSSWLSLRASSNRLRPYLRPDNKMDGIDTEDTDTPVHMPSLQQPHSHDVIAEPSRERTLAMYLHEWSLETANFFFTDGSTAKVFSL